MLHLTEQDKDMKRRSTIARKLRDRRSGQSCYQKYGKREYRYQWQAPWKRKNREAS
jgi:hypothetical protein